ncbi:MAG: chitobiase/beta-hexosaminidase C-terminal domain-containing protein [Terracidiphilus sp.]
MKSTMCSQFAALAARWSIPFRAAVAIFGMLAASAAIPAAGQTAPTGNGPDPNLPVVATTTSGPVSGITYLLNEDESVYYLNGSTIGYQSGCPTLDTTQIVPGDGDVQSILYDPTANLLYIQSPLSDNDTGIVYETPDPAGNCNPSSVVDLIGMSGTIGGARNYSNTMALDSTSSTLYVVDSFQGAFQDKLYTLDTQFFGSYSTSTPPTSYPLDIYGNYGQLVIDPTSHLVYLPESGGLGSISSAGNGPGFWVFDPSQSKIVRVLGYVDPTSSSHVDLSAVTMFAVGNGKIVIVNNNPGPSTTFPTDAMIELDTTQFSFFSNTQAGTSFTTGVYLEPPASAITLYPRHAEFSNISAADFDSTHGIVYVAAYLEASNSNILLQGLALGYNLASPATAEIEYADNVPQPTTFSPTTYGTWTQLSYDAYSNRLLFLCNTNPNAAEAAVTPRLGGAGSLEGLIAPTEVTNFSPVNGVVNQNSGYIYVSSVDNPHSGSPTNPVVFYFAPIGGATGPAADTVTLEAVPATAEVGASITFNVILQSAATTGTPTGNVIVTATPSGGAAQQVAQVSAATALASGPGGTPVSILLTPAANYALAASYAGDTNFAAATSPSYTVDVEQGTDTLTLTVPTTATAGVPFTVNAILTTAGGAAPPTGTISILAAVDGGTAQPIASVPAATVAAAGSSGTPVSVTLSTPGAYVFSASYAGNLDYPAAASSDYELEILAPAPTPEGLAILVPGTITSQDSTIGTAGSILSATAFDSQGNFYILDSGLNQLSEIPVGGASQVIVPQTGGAITLSSPSSLIAEAGGTSFLISDHGNNRLVRVELGSTVTVSALPQTTVPAGIAACPNVVANTNLCEPTGIGEDSSGNIYVSDTGNGRVLKLDPFGNYLSTVLSPGTSGLAVPLGLAIDASGNLWVANDSGTTSSGTIFEVPAKGSVATISSGAIVKPYGLAVDPAGDVYFSDASLLNVSVITASGFIYPFAGNGLTSDSGDNGPATAAGIASPLGVMLDPQGDVYIADSVQTAPNGGEIRKVTPSSTLRQFGDVQISTPSSPSQQLLLNGGAASLSITGAIISGANSADFALTNSCPNSLPSGMACSLSVTFTPSTAAAESATLTVTDNSGGTAGTTQTVALTGTGTNTATVDTPSISPPSGTYNTIQSVTITDATNGATIYYTTDGSTPSSSSTKYTGAFMVSVSGIVRAIAEKAGLQSSAIAQANYTLQIGTTPAPTFTPPGGTVGAGTTVTIKDSGISPVTIYYTTDGTTTPTHSSTSCTVPCSVVLTSTIGATETIQAIASSPGIFDSAVGSATYTTAAASFTFQAFATNPVVNGLPIPTSTLGTAASPVTTASSNAITVSFILKAQNGFNAPVTITISPGTAPTSAGVVQPIQTCVDANGNPLYSGGNPCPGTYTPTAAGTPVYVSFYYDTAPLPTNPLAAMNDKSRMATGGLTFSLAALVFGTLLRRRRILMAAANFIAIVCLVLSLGVLVGACNSSASVQKKTLPANTAVVSSTVTATPSGGAAVTDTVWLTYTSY